MNTVGWCECCSFCFSFKEQVYFICLVHTMIPFGILHFQFPFWNYTTQLYTTQLLCIWPPLRMCPLSRQKRDLHRAGLWQWFCWRPTLFDEFSPGLFNICTQSPYPSLSFLLALFTGWERCTINTPGLHACQSELNSWQIEDFLIFSCNCTLFSVWTQEDFKKEKKPGTWEENGWNEKEPDSRGWQQEKYRRPVKKRKLCREGREADRRSEN